MPQRLRVLLLIVVLILAGGAGLALVNHLRHPLAAGGGPRLLVYEVPGDIDEVPPTLSPFSLGSLRRSRPSLADVTAAVRHAADDDDIKALVLHVGDIGWGWAKVAEMREALATFRAAGKPVWVSLQGGSNQSYLLVSRADHIAMPPTANLGLVGLTASAMFLKGTYDKLGISPNFQHVGQFKSAVETYTRTSFSPPARTALESLLDDLYGQMVDSLAASRRVSVDSMRATIDAGPYTGTTAMGAGLVDTLLDEPDLDSLAAGADGKPLTPVDLARYADALPTPGGENEIALVTAAGAIVPGKSHDNPWSGSELGSETLIAALRDLRARRSVRAVVLRIDSPGGSGEASDDIWQEVRRLRKVKPVVVSMSNYAASGGYYIACGADAIVAEPATLTGSIGVFGGKLNLLGLYHKLGLNVETVSRGRHADMMSPLRDFTPEESARFQAQLDDFYRVFLARVASGRGMSTARVDSLAQGRVWSGIAARRAGLIDALGGVQAAVAIAKRRAHLAPHAEVALVVWPPPKRNFLRRWIDEVADDGDAQSRASLPPVIAAWLEAARFPAGAALALMPVSIEIR